MAFEGAPEPADRVEVIRYKIARYLYNAFGGGGGGGGGSPTTLAAGPAQAVTAASGSVGSGKKSVSFVTSSDWVGTINGASFPAGASKSYDAPPGYILPTIPYTRSAGTLYIDFLA